jgi:hypothetical protein
MLALDIGFIAVARLKGSLFAILLLLLLQLDEI